MSLGEEEAGADALANALGELDALLVRIAGVAACFPRVVGGDDQDRVNLGLFNLIKERDKLTAEIVQWAARVDSLKSERDIALG